MGLFDVFRNAAEIEAREAKKDYGRAQQTRRRILNSFREAAIREITFTNPDAIFLINPLFDRFVAFSPGRKRLFFGDLGDRYVPDLDTIPIGSTPADQRKITAAFDRECNYAKTGHPRSAIRRKYSGLATDYVEMMMSKGYSYRERDAVFIIGATVFRNDTVIARSAPDEVHAVGYLSRSIYGAVISDYRQATGGVSCIEIRLELLGPNVFDTIKYELLYSDLGRARPEINRDYLERLMSPVGSFLTAIEPFLNYSPHGDEDFDWSAHPDFWLVE